MAHSEPWNEVQCAPHELLTGSIATVESTGIFLKVGVIEYILH
jgi:hypothetical protein